MAIMSAREYAASQSAKQAEAAAAAYRASQPSSSSSSSPVYMPPSTSSSSSSSSGYSAPASATSGGSSGGSTVYHPGMSTPAKASSSPVTTVPAPTTATSGWNNGVQYETKVQGPGGTQVFYPQGPPADQLAAQAAARQAEMLRKQAEAEQAAKLAALQTSVGTAKNSLQNDFARSQQQINDSRVLNNNMLGRSLNPFSGQSDYIKAQTQREYANVDAAVQKELTNRLSNYDAQLADAQNASQGAIQSRIDELTARDRQYALQLANQELQRQQQAYSQYADTRNFDYGSGQDTIRNNQTQQQINLSMRAQRVKEAADLSDRFGIMVEPKEDYQLMIDQVAGLPTAAARTAEQQAAAAQKSEAWKVVELLGYVPDAFAPLLGIQAGTQTARAKEAAMDNALKQRQIAVSERKAATSERSASSRTEQQAGSYKNNTEFADDLSYIYQNPAAALSEIQNNVQALIAAYGKDGYDALLKEAQRVTADQQK